MVGRDGNDATSVVFSEPIETPTAERLDGLTLAVPTALVDGEGIEPGVRQSFEASLETARSLGATIIDCEIPSARYALSAYYVIAPAEASSNLSRFDGVRYGLRVDESNLDAMYTETRHDGFGAEVKRRILIGTYALSSGYYDAYYGRAQRVRTLVARELAGIFERADFIVTPTSPTVAFGLGDRTSDPLAMYLSDLFTIPMSLAGTPAISIPSGLSEGLPVGLQICGPAFSENRILGAAHALEGAIGFDGSVTWGGAN
jgi:aspartyl-tRNA(Asn)/glutamyl-tRNA(Gln) amidotransferase subunit A